jgi:hypothetical protein
MRTDFEAEINKNHEKLEGQQTYALIMIKPHAIKEVSDSVILDMFDGNYKKYTPDMNLEPSAANSLKSVTLVTHFYRRLDDPRYRPVLDFLYQKENGKKHHSIILEEYAGPCVFMLVSSSMEAEEFYDGLQKLKGKERLVDREKKIIQKGTGIRSVLIMPRQSLDLDNLSDNEIRTITKNVIHVPDTQQESAKAIRILMPPSEIDNLSTKNDSFKRFMAIYAPVDII